MPVAIVISRNEIIPAIYQHSSVVALVQHLQDHVESPDLTSETDARLWLLSLPQPSGWFETPAEAQAHVEQMKEKEPILSGATVRAARDFLGLTQTQLAKAVGIGGNEQTQRSAIEKIETEYLPNLSKKDQEAVALGKEVKPRTKRVLNTEGTRKLRALLAAKVISDSQD